MKIEFSNNHSDKSILKYIDGYGRFHGWYLANRLDLPTQKECYLITDENDIKHISETRILYCRADLPWGKGNNLPRSIDVGKEEIISFFNKARQISEESIVLAFLHPSIWVTNHYLPRYQSSGGAQIYFRDDGTIIIEMVGKGFDCGDISRGKTVHQRIFLDKETLYYSYDELLKQNRYSKSFYQISQSEYEISRAIKIKEMLSFYGEEYSDDIITFIEKDLFCFDENYDIIIQQCILPVLKHEEIWDNHVIMLNLYQNFPYVYEVWQPKRSMIS